MTVALAQQVDQSDRVNRVAYAFDTLCQQLGLPWCLNDSTDYPVDLRRVAEQLTSQGDGVMPVQSDDDSRAIESLERTASILTTPDVGNSHSMATEDRGEGILRPRLWRALCLFHQSAYREHLRHDVPLISIAPWPSNRPMAAILSHDVDQIYDREFFRVLADANHLRHLFLGAHAGNGSKCLRRIARSLLWPKRTQRDFETIVELESSHGFRSTFFMLEDRYWARMGSRYRLDDPSVQDIANLILKAGSELAVHGGWYRFNQEDGYRGQATRFEDCFGFQPKGIRNHHLRFSFPDTWRSQVAAGFRYDATFGFNNRLGYRSPLPRPYFVFDSNQETQLDLVSIPLTTMDTTLFRYQRLNLTDATLQLEKMVQCALDHQGLISLLWHNNFFNEPEYHEWHESYRVALGLLEQANAYVATAEEINAWIRARAGFHVNSWECSSMQHNIQLGINEDLSNAVVQILCRHGYCVNVEENGFECSLAGPVCPSKLTSIQSIESGSHLFELTVPNWPSRRTLNIQVVKRI